MRNFVLNNKQIAYKKSVQGNYYYFGNISLLSNNPIAIFCSREIPLSIYYTANEAFIKLFSSQIVLAGGWHSTMEKRLLSNFNANSKASLIYFLAKGIEISTEMKFS